MLESNEDASVADDEDEEGDDGGEDELGPHLVVMGVKYRQRPRRRRSHLLSCLLLFCVPVRLHVDKSRLFTGRSAEAGLELTLSLGWWWGYFKLQSLKY